MGTHEHSRRIRECAGPGYGVGVLARRKPMLLFASFGLFLLRFAERSLLGLLFQAPPRSARPLSDPIPGGEGYRIQHRLT
uniref:Uncharacterized protein n=1 Tax=Candidatus Kentrum sp. FW TaxID=2126338 RepID=A0A450SAT4_9GAMM|nr:MAG: hypothetical protein BECKFW1821A_GA0114235_102241 [Candidatus Kentron sp. FW]